MSMQRRAPCEKRLPHSNNRASAPTSTTSIKQAPQPAIHPLKRYRGSGWQLTSHTHRGDSSRHPDGSCKLRSESVCHMRVQLHAVPLRAKRYTLPLWFAVFTSTRPPVFPQRRVLFAGGERGLTEDVRRLEAFQIYTNPPLRENRRSDPKLSPRCARPRRTRCSVLSFIVSGTC